jgi:archaellum biogenesis protein FlaJ (TadC family)
LFSDHKSDSQHLPSDSFARVFVGCWGLQSLFECAIYFALRGLFASDYVWYRLTRRPERQRCVVAMTFINLFIVASIIPLVWVLAASEVTIRFAVLNGTVALYCACRSLAGCWFIVSLCVTIAFD